MVAALIEMRYLLRTPNVHSPKLPENNTAHTIRAFVRILDFSVTPAPLNVYNRVKHLKIAILKVSKLMNNFFERQIL